MRDYLSLGSSPCDEQCAQVGSDSYAEQSRRECRAYVWQLRRMFPAGEFGIKSFSHDFGTYREVVIYYDNETAACAFGIESILPEVWDAEARIELGLTTPIPINPQSEGNGFDDIDTRATD